MYALPLTNQAELSTANKRSQSSCHQVLVNLRRGMTEDALSHYGEWYRELMALGCSSWQDHLLDEVGLHSVSQPHVQAVEGHNEAACMHADYSGTQ